MVKLDLVKIQGAILHRNTDYSVALLEGKKKTLVVFKRKNAKFFLLTLIKVQINCFLVSRIFLNRVVNYLKIKECSADLLSCEQESQTLMV